MAAVAGSERYQENYRYNKGFPPNIEIYDDSPFYHHTIDYWRRLEGILDGANIPQTLVEIARELGNTSVLRRTEFQRYLRRPHILLLREGMEMGYCYTQVTVKDFPRGILEPKPLTFEIWNSTFSGYPRVLGEVIYSKKPDKHVQPVGKEGLVEKIKELIPAALPWPKFSHVFSFGPLHSESICWEDALEDGRFYKQLYP